MSFTDYENVNITEPQDPDHPGRRTNVTITFKRPDCHWPSHALVAKPPHPWPGALRQQVTRTGLAYSGAIVIVTLAAVLSANNLLFLILAAMLSILAISGFVSKLTLAGLEIDLLLPPHISARRTIPRHRPPQKSQTLDAILQHPRHRSPPGRSPLTATSAPAAMTALSSSR